MATHSKLCIFFKKGFCRYGVDCPYSHQHGSGSLPSQIFPEQPSTTTTDNWRENPRKVAQTAAQASAMSHTSTRPCHYFQEGRCMYGEQCKLSHEMIPRTLESNNNVCAHFLAGTCIYGDKCRCPHPAEMTRDSVETTIRISSEPKRISVSSLLESYPLR
jgi:hypothetical protein